jgi:choline dehydrogenase
LWSAPAQTARRLVDAGADVLLIEAGPPGIGIADIDDPGKWVAAQPEVSNGLN